MASITDLTTSTTAANSMPIINTNFDNLNSDKAEISGQTFTGKVQFSGTTHAGLEVNSLTTTQRDALTPQNGDLIYNTTTTQFEFYENGIWVSLSGVADASTTVKGIVEEATESEMVAGTAAGGTSARLFVNPSTLSDKILTADERTLVRAVEGVTDATEINQLAGTTNIAEANTFFGSTDISGSEAETLTDGSDADALHAHDLGRSGATVAGGPALATTYQNTGTGPLLVVATVKCLSSFGTGDTDVVAKMDAASPPTTVVGSVLDRADGGGGAGPSGTQATITLIVPPSYYYRFDTTIGTGVASIDYLVSYTLQS